MEITNALLWIYIISASSVFILFGLHGIFNTGLKVNSEKRVFWAMIGTFTPILNIFIAFILTFGLIVANENDFE